METQTGEDIHTAHIKGNELFAISGRDSRGLDQQVQTSVCHEMAMVQSSSHRSLQVLSSTRVRITDTDL